MRSFDFTPLYRTAVGFDRIADLMGQATAGSDPQPGYPPYNIEKTAEDAYRISVAVAGFAPEELSVELRDGAVIVAARKAAQESEKNYLHRGIATRAFERRFALADHVHVTGAAHENGMLHIDLIRELPEAMRPRKIEIASRQPSTAQEIEAKSTSL